MYSAQGALICDQSTKKTSAVEEPFWNSHPADKSKMPLTAEGFWQQDTISQLTGMKGKKSVSDLPSLESFFSSPLMEKATEAAAKAKAYGKGAEGFCGSSTCGMY